MDGLLAEKWLQAVRSPGREVRLRFRNGEELRGWLTNFPLGPPENWTSDQKVYVANSPKSAAKPGEPRLVGQIVDIEIL